MTAEHKGGLVKNRVRLVHELRVDSILNFLQQEQTLTHRDCEDIRNGSPRYKQAELLLDILGRKPNSSYNCFVTALRQSGQPHLANLLQPQVSNLTGNILI